jgi:BirA family transcriptional regulator, biotin operon repressor / biotin---[acetyl-CoA-carboxylase] ligase
VPVTGGFSDLERPPLRQRDLERALVRATGPWTSVRVAGSLPSTNAEVASLARAGTSSGLVLVAEEQTAGRGRLERTWSAPARAGLTFSVLLRPTGVPAAAWGWFPLLAGVAVAGATASLAELDVRLKWPNDVLVGDRKLAGILAERVDDAVVLGVGLNVSLRADELPVASATSLRLENAAVVDRMPVLLAVLRAMGRLYDEFVAASGVADASGLRSSYRGLCETLGRSVRAELPGGHVVTGTAVDVDDSGRLVLDTPGGTEQIGAGDVVHLR